MFTGGVEGIQQVIATGCFAELAKQTHWRRPEIRPRPATPAQLEGLRLPGDRPLPETWRAWLAFDTAWLTSFGWFAPADDDGDALTFTPRTLKELVADQLGEMWAEFYDVPRLEHCFLLPGGSDSRRVLVLSDAPDRQGEHPVLFIDVDDMPALGVMYAGLDIYLGWAAGLLPEPKTRYATYTDTAKLLVQRGRCAHHAAHLLRGEWEVEFPVDALRR